MRAVDSAIQWRRPQNASLKIPFQREQCCYAFRDFPVSHSTVDTLASADSKETPHTPAFNNFDQNTDRLSHLLSFTTKGIHGYAKIIAADVASALDKLNLSTGPKSQDEVSNLKERVAAIGENISELQTEMVEGINVISEWTPVIIVTIAETYLKDVLTYAARIDKAIMQSSESTVFGNDVLNASSLEELADEIRGKWARRFIDDGGPKRWIEKLIAMGARGYQPNTSEDLEVLWGVRHLVVHSAGIATAEFNRRHPGFPVKLGDRVKVTSELKHQWIACLYDFVRATDRYFVRRCTGNRAATEVLTSLPEEPPRTQL